MPALPPTRRNTNLDLQRAVLVCVDAALAAMDLGTENPNRAAHLVRREMKRLRAVAQLAPKPNSDWLAEVATGAAAIHRELAELRDGCVVAATFEKIRARHPRRWRTILPARAGTRSVSSGKVATTCAVVRGQLEGLKTPGAAKVPGVESAVVLGEALERTYRKARRARAIVPAVLGQEEVHAWRKAMYRLCFQLELADPFLAPAARKVAPELALLTRKLGRCGDLAMAGQRLEERKLVGVKARTRAQLLEWIERRRQKIARELLAGTAEYFERRPREFAKWCLRRES